MIGPVHPTHPVSRFFADMWMLFPTEDEYFEVCWFVCLFVFVCLCVCLCVYVYGLWCACFTISAPINKNKHQYTSDQHNPVHHSGLKKRGLQISSSSALGPHGIEVCGVMGSSWGALSRESNPRYVLVGLERDRHTTPAKEMYLHKRCTCIREMQ